MKCSKCGSSRFFSTSDISESTWTCCKDCGYSDEYPGEKVIGWETNHGFPILESDSDEEKGHEDAVLWVDVDRQMSEKKEQAEGEMRKLAEVIHNREELAMDTCDLRKHFEMLEYGYGRICKELGVNPDDFVLGLF